MKIKNIKKIKRNKEDVYNLEVKDNNNYFANSLLVSNCHGLRRGNEINKIFNIVGAKYKFGFTGTMPPSLIDQWNIIGKIGPIIYEEKTLDLKEKNYVSDFKIMILDIKHQNIPNFNKNVTLPAEAYNG